MLNYSERVELIAKYREKLESTYKFKVNEPILELIDYIQTLIEFAFALHGYDNVPQLILDQETEEKNSEVSIEYDRPKLFVQLNKRAYSPIDSNSKKLFTHEDVILASSPKHIFTKEEEIDGNKIPIETKMILSDNEIKLILQTKTMFEQLKILSILEKAINIYSKVIVKNFINAIGIIKIDKESYNKENKETKIDLKTINLYIQARLREDIEYDKTYLVEAFEIFANQEIHIDGHGDNHNIKDIDSIDKFPPLDTNEDNIFELI